LVRVNVRFLIVTALVTAVVAAIAYFWRQHQVRRNADAVLRKAHELGGQDDWKGAADLYFRYLQLAPDDDEVHVRLAEAFDKAARRPAQAGRAIELYSRAIARNPDHPKIRELYGRQAVLLLEMGRFQEAELRARWLLGQTAPIASGGVGGGGAPARGLDGGDPAALRLLAQALEARYRQGEKIAAAEVVAVLTAAVDVSPGDVGLAVALARLYREPNLVLADLAPAERVRRADATIDNLVRQTSGAAGYLARHRYRVLHGLPGADEDLCAAKGVAPDDPEVLLLCAEGALREGRTAEALEYGHRMVSVAPKDRRGHVLLVRAQLNLGDRDAAIATCQAAFGEVGGQDLDLNLLLVQALIAGREKGPLTASDLQAANTAMSAAESAFQQIASRVSTPDRRRAIGALDVTRAQLLVARGEPLAAAAVLRRAAAGHTAGDDAEEDLRENVRRWRLLGDIYAGLEWWDLAAAAYDEAATKDVSSPVLKFLVASAWEKAGQLDLAVRNLKEALSRPSAPADYRLPLAAVQLRQQLALPEEARDWTEFDKSLAEALQDSKSAWRLSLLVAQSAAARGDKEAALAALEAAESDEVAARQILPAAALLYETWGEPVRADQAIDKLKDIPGVETDEAILRAELLRRRGSLGAAAAVLDRAYGAARGDQRPAVVYARVAVALAAGNVGDASGRLWALTAERPNDPKPLQQLLDLAIRENDLALLRRVESSLERLEGPQGSLATLARATRLLHETEAAGGGSIFVARKLAAELEGLRPSWPPVYLLKGRIAQHQKQDEEAAEAYREAIRLGSRNVTALEQLVVLLYQQDRPADVLALLSRLQREGQLERAVELARAAADHRQPDPMGQIWLGYAQNLAGQDKQALETLQKATRVAPNDERTWFALVSLHALHERIDLARRAIDDMGQRSKLAAGRLSLARAQCFELIGDRQEAERSYRQAIEADERDLRAYELLGRFYLRYDPPSAKGVYRKIVELRPKDPAPARLLAVALASTGRDDDWQEALGLLEAAGSRAPAAPADRRLQALLSLSRGNRSDRQRARELLRILVASPESSTAADRLMLARIAEIEGDADEAKSHFEALVAHGPSAPAHLTLYIDFLLRHGGAAEAGSLLDQLEQQDGDNPQTMRLRAYWLKSQNRTDEIEPLVESDLRRRLQTAGSEERKATALLDAANVYELAGQAEPARRCLERLAEIDRRRGYQPLAMWLARHDCLADGVALCLQNSSHSDALEAERTLARMLTWAAGQAMPPADVPAAAEVSLREALDRAPEDPTLLFDVASLRYVQGRSDEAAALFRRVLAASPAHVGALNNLALLVSEQPGNEAEAVQLIDRAISLSSRSVELADTKALVLLNLGRVGEARTLLDQVVADQPGNRRYRLHLAVALHRAGAVKAAWAALEAAGGDHLHEEFLSPRERRWLEALVAAAKARVSTSTPPRPQD
jgi:tetratricopeptide (TPR) repeat protein